MKFVQSKRYVKKLVRKKRTVEELGSKMNYIYPRLYFSFLKGQEM